MNRNEMMNQPFVRFDLPSGVLAFSRKLEQLPSVIDEIGFTGVIICGALSFERLNREYPDIFQEIASPKLLLRSISPPRDEKEKVEKEDDIASTLPTIIRWSNIPGSESLESELAVLGDTKEGKKLLLAILNSQCVLKLKKPDPDFVENFGYIGISTALLTTIGAMGDVI